MTSSFSGLSDASRVKTLKSETRRTSLATHVRDVFAEGFPLSEHVSSGGTLCGKVKRKGKCQNGKITKQNKVTARSVGVRILVTSREGLQETNYKASRGYSSAIALESLRLVSDACPLYPVLVSRVVFPAANGVSIQRRLYEDVTAAYRVACSFRCGYFSRRRLSFVCQSNGPKSPVHAYHVACLQHVCTYGKERAFAPMLRVRERRSERDE
ncbi:hypothetical protein MTO96_045636 [Rhipicephalus appendiculatus]